MRDVHVPKLIFWSFEIGYSWIRDFTKNSPRNLAFDNVGMFWDLDSWHGVDFRVPDGQF